MGVRTTVNENWPTRAIGQVQKDTEHGDAKSPCSVYVPQLLPVDSPDLQQQTTDYRNKEKPR
jgi:hypothetical protein